MGGVFSGIDAAFFANEAWQELGEADVVLVRKCAEPAGKRHVLSHAARVAELAHGQGSRLGEGGGGAVRRGQCKANLNLNLNNFHFCIEFPNILCYTHFYEKDNQYQHL